MTLVKRTSSTPDQTTETIESQRRVFRRYLAQVPASLPAEAVRHLDNLVDAKASRLLPRLLEAAAYPPDRPTEMLALRILLDSLLVSSPALKSSTESE